MPLNTVCSCIVIYIERDTDRERQRERERREREGECIYTDDERCVCVCNKAEEIGTDASELGVPMYCHTY